MKAVKKYRALSKKTISIVLGITFLIAVTGYSMYKYNTGNKVAEEMLTREREYVVKKGDITAGTNGSGAIKLEQITQNFEEAVMIGEVFVNEGQSVKKGDKIASISETFINDKLVELNSQLKQATAALNSAKNNKQATALTQNKEWQDKVQTSKKQYESQRDSIINNINGLNKRVNDVNKKIEVVKNQIEELSKSTEENELKLQELKENETSLIAEKASIESELNTANLSLTSLNNDRNKDVSLESKEAAANTEINALSNSSLDEAISNAQKEVDKINNEISKINKLKENSILYAEADGIILALNCSKGATTSLDTPVITIGESDKVLAEINVSQNDITKIEEGQAAYISVSAFQDEKLNGKVKYINLKPNSQGNSITYSVTVEVDKNDLNILHGMTVSTQFIVKEVKDVLMLSNKAITLKDGKQIVNLRQEDGTLKEVEITTGFSDGKNSEIKSGLSEGDTVVIGGQ
ncbi:efflux RND transporter periplasmic adaptor subunit [Clostridium sp. D53t1_180928_C8]|uniref:efflux RND transporter periplasmic adaptor subunit n=1 Tax=Clostridium sp. D53t1_180928_C8 TaxID=2787101 RepID=UPI0018AA9F14|nr:efflux RND transporter periplasmic adaptor subunit [Clostridium sp. D53t1_180928_C8]